ncbi:sigma-54-dependent transcriptional regulator [Roseateles depolymerans]|uniref:Two-component system response regulator PilR n=1 Tax=Roseateles depolymerans TaxID=76731 RepID=A0A0U3NJM2_9BURK|nr:sigma-54 dependent transcriptional regulator [Roseateles depolymerans]ALV08608.1 Two-component system response regulator PilR [Roseateles depolymerans]REG21166.1 two-component system response regulator PilR (NtrC family) [Roseateles depolymerans]
MSADSRLLVVDDEPDLRTLYEMTLLREGFALDSAGTVEDALALLDSKRYDAVITDMRLPDGTGLDVLRWLEQRGRSERAIVITAYGSPENAVEALKAGAYDYLTKPVDLRQFRMVVASALGRVPRPESSASTMAARAPSPGSAGGPAPFPATGAVSAASPSSAASAVPASPSSPASPASQPSYASASASATAPAPTMFGNRPLSPAPLASPPPHESDAPTVTPMGAAMVEASRKAALPRGRVAAAGPVSALERLVGDSAAMRQVRQLIEKVARSMAPVLLNGESGTGKELVARAIHDVSARRPQPFIAVNCGAIPEQLLEAEFFGYRKGAFTGATEDREGFFQAAQGGTLFLDEIGDLPLAMQSKLLRALQERSVRPVGAVAEMPVNVRLLSATHKDLAAEVMAGRFRQDLYYRLNVIQIRVPPLRERMEDLAPISARVLERIATDAGVEPVPQLTAQGLAALGRYSFPGNVRELENLLHRALALSGGETIDVADLDLPEALLEAEEVPEAVTDTADLAQGVPLPAEALGQAPLPSDLATYLDEVEKRLLLRALEHYRNNRTAAGASLGLSLRQMRYRMARLGISLGADDN